MKKPGKTTSSKSNRTAGSSKHAKSTAKPVTLDLKAEDVSAKPAANKTSPSKTSVPKSISQKNDGKSETRQTPFGRDADKNTSAIKSASTDKTSTKTSDRKPSASSSQEAEAKKPKTQTPQPSPSQLTSQKSSGGMMGKVGAGIVGGIIALAGSSLIQSSGMLGSNDAPSGVSVAQFDKSQSDLSAKIAELETQLAAAQNGISTQDVDARIATKLTEFQKSSSTESSESIDSVVTQLNETTVRVEKIQKDLDTLATTTGELSQSVSEGSAGDGAAAAALTKRIDTLAAEVKAIAEKPAEPSEKTTTALTALQAALPALKQAVGEQISGVQKSLSSKLTQLEEKTAALTSGFQDVKAKSEEAQAIDKKAAAAIAAAALKSDIDLGQSFEASLNTLMAVSENKDGLEKLRPFAANGVPTMNQLTAAFGDVKPAILRSVEEKPADDLASRLLAGAKSLVKVQSLKPQEGTNILALTSKIEDALNKNNAKDAADVWSSLPKPAQEASSAWHDSLQARLSVDGLIAESVQSYLLSTTQ